MTRYVVLGSEQYKNNDMILTYNNESVQFIDFQEEDMTDHDLQYEKFVVQNKEASIHYTPKKLTKNAITNYKQKCSARSPAKPKRKSRSKVWMFFSINKDKDIATCVKCECELVYKKDKPVTTHLLRHINAFHGKPETPQKPVVPNELTISCKKSGKIFYHCLDCSKKIEGFDDIKKHFVQFHKNEIPKNYSCSSCKKTGIFNIVQARIHELDHNK